jgi:uncharacterized membrane protein YvlD (DUF360 family)
MNRSKVSLLLTIACFTGFFGDACLQLLVHAGMGGNTGWGLKEYFQQHGRAEAMTIAAGMMTIFYAIYIVILNLPLKWYYLVIYGVVLDLIFRVAMLYPSLKGYYEHLNYFWSAFWGAIPMLLPFWLYNQTT